MVYAHLRLSCYFPWLYLVKSQSLLISLHGLSGLNVDLFLCDGKNEIFFRFSARSCGFTFGANSFFKITTRNRLLLCTSNIQILGFLLK